MIVGTTIIREPFVEARCVPLRAGGWRVTTTHGTTEHPHASDPRQALDLHFRALDRSA